MKTVKQAKSLIGKKIYVDGNNVRCLQYKRYDDNQQFNQNASQKDSSEFLAKQADKINSKISINLDRQR